MLFSALIDADRLDTERFCDPEVSESRELERPSISTLLKNLEMQIQALSTGRADIVSAMRARVVDDTRAAANRDRGLFSLTVPTGGGKTLSGMLFALKHALRHRLKRVIVAIPFTSITEQTADVYRSIFGEAAVVEHHSAIDPIRDTDANRRASENWDAPIIVTTNVQLFETMFTNRPSRARKLHSISESVLILDEAQTLPVGFLEPILHALNECVEHYRSSVVFSTATQPAFSGSMIGDRKGLVCAEIIRDQRTLFESLERVTVSLPSDLTQPTSWEQIAERIRDERQALVITHQRKDARQLASLLPSSLHLSAAMCAEHRSAVIREVKRRLLMNEHCILVSTQVVEAGVDIDFPLVLRALGPLDSLAQAAGRCNREGRLRDADGNLTTGLFEIYVPPSLPPPSTRSAISVTSTILNTRGFSLTDPALFSSYFARLYRACVTDEKGIQHLRRNFNFERVAEAFVLIDDSQVPVVVPYGDAQRHVERLNSALEAGKGERRALRALQRFIVNVPRSTLKTLVEQGEIEELGDLIRVLRTSERYDATFGLRTD
jgi:CRISPR-associated endonuclease/helicase Cas3